MGIRVGGTVEKARGREVSYDEFVQRFMEVNRPVVFTDLMDGWMASRDWLTPDTSPHLLFFSATFGDSLVQVANCGVKESTDQQRMEMPMSVFVDQWLNDSRKEDDSPLLYLKDWHFAKEYPKYTAYTTPFLFCDDWLNMYLDNYGIHEDTENPTESRGLYCSDYRFVYMGKKVCHRNMKNSVYDIFEDNIDETTFPGFRESVWLECIQEKDEIIFVPSGWYHQVHNLEDTISINHNWFNGHNISWVWGLLLKDYNEAKQCIEDVRDLCDDFEALCQRNLKANSGMDLNDFFLFMVRMCLANLVILAGGGPFRPGPAHRRHLAGNLVSIRKTASAMYLSGRFSPRDPPSADVIATLSHPGFVGLLRDMSRTYAILHGDDVAVEYPLARFVEKPGCFGVVVAGPGDIVRLVDRSLEECV